MNSRRYWKRKGPPVELGEAVDAAGGERHTVVGADGPGQAIGPEAALEEPVCPRAMGRGQAVAGQQEAGVPIRNRERIAVDPVTRHELPFEVRGPEVVGLGGRRGHHPWMLVGTTPAPLRDEPPAGSDEVTRSGQRTVSVPFMPRAWCGVQAN